MQYFINEKERQASKSTNYLEFQMGHYHNVCWLDNSISISGQIWSQYRMSQLVHRVVPEFDYYDFTEITIEKWNAIVAESQKDEYICKEIIQEAIPWVEKCFEAHDVFTICGL